MSISLANSNNKVMLIEDGSFSYDNVPENPEPSAMVTGYPRRIIPQLGSGRKRIPMVDDKWYSRYLDGRWYPIPVIQVKENGLVYRQRLYVTIHPAAQG